LNEPPGKLGKRLEKWIAACLQGAGIQQESWRKGRASGRLQQLGIDGSPLDLLRNLAALRLHRRQKNFEKACQLSRDIAGKDIYTNERKWQAAVRKARQLLQKIHPVPE
jgi:hypothetical protein